MNNKMIALGLSLLLFAAPVSAGATETQTQSQMAFADVSKAHWSYSAIQWGLGNQIVSGYPDGSYKPDQNVTQSEFLAMLLKAYKVVLIESSQGETWDMPFLRYARENNWTLVADTSQPVNRGQVAKLLASAAGQNYNTNDSIYFLLNTGLSNGKTERSIAGYKADDSLTRAEAIAFIKNVKAKIEQLSASSNEEKRYTPIHVDSYFPFTWDSRPSELTELYQERNLKVIETYSEMSTAPVTLEVSDVPFSTTTANLKIELLDVTVRNFDYTTKVGDIKSAQKILKNITDELNYTYNNGQDIEKLFKLDFVIGTTESGLIKDNRLSEYTMQDILTDEKKAKRALQFLNFRLSAILLPDGKNRISIFMYKPKNNSEDNAIRIKLSYVKDKFNFPSSLF